MKSISIVIFLFLTINISGQTDKSEFAILASKIPKESVRIDINNDILLCGEYLLYKVYLISDEANIYSSISKIAYVELVGSNSNIIFKHKLKVENGIAHNSFFLPSDIKTGEYKLIAYTNWSKNFFDNDGVEIISIYIINPFNSEKQAVGTDANTIEIKTGKLTKANNQFKLFKLKTDKQEYNSREEIIIHIQSDIDSSSSYSLSVKKVDSIDFFNQTEKSNTLKLTDNNGYFLPEIRGEIVSGKILSKNNKEIDNKIVSLSFPGKTFSFYNSKTNNKGEFNFILGENHTTEICLIQLQDKEDSQYQVTLNNSSTFEYSDLNFNDITLNQDLKEWLKTKNIENQIENSYFEIKQNKTVSLDPPGPFFLNKGFTYFLDDYTRFPTVKEVFIEIINSAYISGKEDSYQFHVSDAANLEFNQLLNIENPLVLVDGISIVNNNDIVNYDAYKIESITIVPGNYIFGPKIYNGIISILTKKGDFVDTLNGDYTKFNVSIPQEIKILYQPDYLNNNLSRIPDYRSQLLWLPDLELNSAQKTITCFSSDSKGLYEVVLSSYTPEGKRIMIKEFFTVN